MSSHRGAIAFGQAPTEDDMADTGKSRYDNRDTWRQGGFSESEAARAAQDAGRVSADFWPLLKRVAKRIPFAEDALAAYYCAFDRDTPLRVRAIIFGALAYFVLPFDVAPDLLPLIGFTDDAAVLAIALRTVLGNIKPEHRAAARRALDRDIVDVS
jgi:uncharacterized membrane protein YkvA (DUF1232 family)